MNIIEPPSTPPEEFVALVRKAAAEPPHHRKAKRALLRERRVALARYAWLRSESMPAWLLARWREHRLVPLGLADAEAALVRAQQAPWWPAFYAQWATWIHEHRRLRLVRHAYLLAQDNPVSFILQTQRSMLQDLGIDDPDAAARAMQSEPWWPALYAAEAAYLAAF